MESYPSSCSDADHPAKSNSGGMAAKRLVSSIVVVWLRDFRATGL